MHVIVHRSYGETRVSALNKEAVKSLIECALDYGQPNEEYIAKVRKYMETKDLTDWKVCDTLCRSVYDECCSDSGSDWDDLFVCEVDEK